jgi:anti-anti-sigma factor
MLKITIDKLGDVMIFHCSGRLAFGNEARLIHAVSKEPRPRFAVLDLAEVTAIDAAGLGVLVSVRNWAKATGTALKLMNLTPRVENLLELSGLRSVFEICSVPEMLGLLCRAFHQSQFAEAEAAAKSAGQVLGDAQLVFVQERNTRRRTSMKTSALGPIREGIAAAIVCLLGLAQIALTPDATAQSNQAMSSRQTPPLMDRQKEVALALSACPPSVVDKAVLRPS